MATDRVERIEEYVRRTMAGVAGSALEIGHDFKHVDQINLQASCYGNLQTTTTKRVARPLVAFMRQFLIHLEWEIDAPTTSLFKSFPDKCK